MDRAAHRGAPSHRPFSNTSSNHDRNHQHNNSFIDQQRVRFAEGGSDTSSQGPKVYQPTPRRASSAAVSVVASSAALPVYWDDKGNGRGGDQGSDANLAGYTFYRERTPTPPDHDGSEKRRHHGGGAGSLVPPGSGIETSTAGGGTIRSDGTSTVGGDYSMRRLHLTDGASWGYPDNNNNRTPLKKTRRFWVVVVIGILMLIGIGLGVGLALGLPRDHDAAVGSPASSNSTATPSGPTPTSSPTDPAPSGTATTAGDPRPTYNSDCPTLNNTIYHVPDSTASFQRVCGVDYSGSGAVDIAQEWTESMAECMDRCASLVSCTACSWGYLKGDQGAKHRCYMKKNLKRAHAAAGDWCFAILQ
ncbi:hypothetical protein B0J18DRAFT_106363 [Chaetomium sp. MPI-SDFR-AT-0129]|nr:hypothetical protein B0J18DRAFT_106363 [Chaetomium sp. MPI-SDFR-AT-0129]